jgi:hypothetical protein
MTLNEEVIQSILAEINSIRDAIKSKQLGQYALQQLFQREKLLQTKLNQLLTKKEILNETEADKVYEELRLQKKESLASKLGKGYTAFILIGVALAVGLYFALKKPKKN